MSMQACNCSFVQWWYLFPYCLCKMHSSQQHFNSWIFITVLYCNTSSASTPQQHYFGERFIRTIEIIIAIKMYRKQKKLIKHSSAGALAAIVINLCGAGRLWSRWCEQREANHWSNKVCDAHYRCHVEENP